MRDGAWSAGAPPLARATLPHHGSAGAGEAPGLGSLFTGKGSASQVLRVRSVHVLRPARHLLEDAQVPLHRPDRLLRPAGMART